ncbi:2'-5' RNA ligase [Bartonella australis AUST/NH1]|uniref:RNA 2',3'-cyclic phosphodiesterase n=1 Tax=Bartonella australis (strain Aust/NH1) TaxID=1094489 RepID=M1N233_BARAA|nr:RNA 2',3'-cyclic phosphodiesterase [Bartonella australis]AGF73959.1 2'-5' RNA ligase [Bartonella australis AUST/NH1]
MLRLFSAIQIPQRTTEELISLQNGLPKAQWINPKNFHVTLSFFGEVEDSIADELIHAFNTIKCPPFALHPVNFKILGSATAPHSLVVRIEPCEILSSLHEKIQRIRSYLGLTPDETLFTPHITLARLLDVKPEDLSLYLSSRSSLSLAPFEVDRFVLLLSENPSSDALYVVKGSWPLQA